MSKFAFLCLFLLICSTGFHTFATESAKDEGTSADESSTTETSLWEQLQQTGSNVAKLSSGISLDAGIAYDEFTLYSQKKFNRFTENMEHQLDLLELMGYSVSDMYIGIELIPSVSVKVRKTKEVSSEQQQKILATLEDNAVLSYMLDKLNAAYKMEIGEYRIESVRMDLSIPPRTSVHFVKLPPINDAGE